MQKMLIRERREESGQWDRNVSTLTWKNKLLFQPKFFTQMPNIWPRTQIFSEIKIKMLGFFIVNLLDRISASQWRNSPLPVPPNYLNLISDLSDDLIRLGWGLAITDRPGMMMAAVLSQSISGQWCQCHPPGSWCLLISVWSSGASPEPELSVM